MNEENQCYVAEQSLDYAIQFYSRLFVLSLAFLSVVFISITLLFSRRLKYWPFKTLFIQCIFEGIDVLGALSVNQQAQSHEQLCSIVGYIMHCSWQTSFCCSLTIIYLYNLSINIDSRYDRYRRNINCWLVFIAILPYLFLFTPFLLHQFGSTGWELYGVDNHQQFCIFCGFKTNKGPYFYLIFWILPIFAIFIPVIWLAHKNKSYLRQVQQSGIITEEINFLKNIQVIPKIYFYSWFLNLFCRIVDLLKILTFFYSNLYFYIFYAFLNIIFELHLTVIAIIFYIFYRKMLKINKIWYYLLRFKIYNPKQGQLIIEELNSDFNQDDDDD